MKHINEVHEGEKLPENVAKCPICLVEFPRKTNWIFKLKRHIESIHRGNASQYSKNSVYERAQLAKFDHGRDIPSVNPEPEVKVTYKKREKKQISSKFQPRKKIRKTEKSVSHSCFICSDRFDQESKLKSHILSEHEGKGPYKCFKCEREFSRIRCKIFCFFSSRSLKTREKF